MRNGLIPVVMLSSLVVVVLFSHGWAQIPATKVVLAEARVVEAQPTVTLVGTVEPVRRSRVSTEIAGLVKQMPVRQGDFIPAGGIICKLNDDVLQFSLASEQARLASLRARHDELSAGTRKEELRRLKAIVDAAEADLERWTFEMERIEKLYTGRDSNEKEYVDIRAEFIAAELRKTESEAAYNLGVEGPRKETIAQAAHNVAEQQARVDRVAGDLAKAVIRVPYAGHVVERITEVGEWVSAGDPIVVVIDLETVLVRVNAPESVLAFLNAGQAVRIKVDALQRSFMGRIRHVMRQADAKARTFPVDIEIDNTDGLLAGGMFARAALPAGPDVRTVAVPKDAVVERDGVSYVAKVIPGPQGGHQGVLLPVTIGVSVEDWITITSDNVEPGTPVITHGTERILPFPTPVQIVDEQGTPAAMPDGKSKSRTQEGPT